MLGLGRAMLDATFLAATVSLGVAVLVVPADAGDRRSAPGIGAHQASPYYRGGPQVRGYTQRRGGYSYSSSDVINTYGDNRSIFGGTNFYRDPSTDRQTSFGPFDHGFFFDSGVGRRGGGDSPYQN